MRFSFKEGEETPFEVIKKQNKTHLNFLEKRGMFNDLRISVNTEEIIEDQKFDENLVENI